LCSALTIRDCFNCLLLFGMVVDDLLVEGDLAGEPPPLMWGRRRMGCVDDDPPRWSLADCRVHLRLHCIGLSLHLPFIGAIRLWIAIIFSVKSA
jgi:hypothetical protein